MTINDTPEKLTYDAVVDADDFVNFAPRLQQITEFLSDGDEKIATYLTLGMSVIINLVKDKQIVVGEADFEDWLAKQGHAIAKKILIHPDQEYIYEFLSQRKKSVNEETR
jgi:hypothetical protein